MYWILFWAILNWTWNKWVTCQQREYVAVTDALFYRPAGDVRSWAGCNTISYSNKCLVMSLEYSNPWGSCQILDSIHQLTHKYIIRERIIFPSLSKLRSSFLSSPILLLPNSLLRWENVCLACHEVLNTVLQIYTARQLLNKSPIRALVLSELDIKVSSPTFWIWEPA
jgi:hypothetical protein